MARERNSFKMGTVEMITLFLLSKKDLYGYQIVSLIDRLSGGKITVQESTLYPTLYKLMDKGYLSDRPVPVVKNRVRVYYHLEDSGLERLENLLEDYRKITAGIEQLLGTDEIGEEAL